MSIESDILEAVRDMLLVEYGIPMRRSTCSEFRCPTCGVQHEQNLDIYKQPNGYCTHPVGECLQNLRERIDRLEKQ